MAFASNPLQPYELEPLWKWMLASDHRHPLTGEPCSLSDIVALKCTDEDKCTVAMLEGMWLTLQNTKVFFSPKNLICQREMRKKWLVWFPRRLPSPRATKYEIIAMYTVYNLTLFHCHHRSLGKVSKKWRRD